MGDHASGDESENIDWNTEDELEIENTAPSSCAPLITRDAEAVIGNGKASSSAGPSNTNLVEHFLGMGFREHWITKALEKNEEGDHESILDTLFAYQASEDSQEAHNSCPPTHLNSPQQQQQCVNNDDLSSDYDENVLDDFSDSDSWPGSETEDIDSLPEPEKTLKTLVAMGYTEEEASTAMERCPGGSMADLTEFIYAAQNAKTEPVFFQDEVFLLLDNI